MNNELNEELKKKLDALEAKWNSEEMIKFVKEQEECEEYILLKNKNKEVKK